MINNHRGEKRGNLNWGGKEPDRVYNQGLDWDAVRRANHARVIDEIYQGIDSPETRLWKKHDLESMATAERDKFLERHALSKGSSQTPRGSSLTPEARARGGRHRVARKADPPEIERLYVEEGKAPNEIALAQGLSPWTVINWLRQRGVYDPKKHLGKTKGRKFPGRGNGR